jgi:GR25 family glycosyltransferase involved in LPS biosynthesis
MKYKIFIISILRNKTRYNSLIEKLIEQGFDKNLITIFLGTDYKVINEDIIKAISSKWGKYTPKSVLCCAASHILLWKYISELKDIDYAIILEDDSYIIKNLFDIYKKDIENVINDNTFLNLSTSFRIEESNQKPTDLFIKSHLVLSLDTYILTPNMCKKLFDFYKKNGVSYHIDLHLAFIKPYLKFNLLHFNKKITHENMRLESSMVSNHDKKFILNMLKDKEVYKELNTPIIEINNIPYNGYMFLTIIIFVLILLFTYFFYDYINKYTPVFIIFAIIWYIFGMLMYDML